MVRAENRPQVTHLRRTLCHAFFVKIIAEYVDAVGSGQVMENIAKIGQGHTCRRQDESAHGQSVAQVATKLERDR